jgi:hypothetical protein
MENYILERAKPIFLQKINLIKYDASRWMQYNSYDYNKELDQVTLFFKTSSYGISFEITIKVFSNIYKPQDLIDLYRFNDIYDYFRKLKYDNIKE